MKPLRQRLRHPPKKVTYRFSPKTQKLVRESIPTYAEVEKKIRENFGTFADSKNAPIHRWFQYPAGFSYKAVNYILDQHVIVPGHTVYDPFVGTGTTIVVCKQRGIESYGVEAHPFVHEIAEVKTDWDINFKALREEIQNTSLRLEFSIADAEREDVSHLPKLVRSCFSRHNLQRLLFIRSFVQQSVSKRFQKLFFVALTCALRQASAAATGWPYIAPKKRIKEKDGLEAFIKQLYRMIEDLESVPPEFRKTPSHIILGDARNSKLPSSFFNLGFTSPPYLNNYDYADRTRLETYFNGYASSWGDITEKVRKKLIVSATTQINRGNYGVREILLDELRHANARVANELQEKVNLLSIKRLEKGGKKSYDIMVGQYFNDMTLALLDIFRVLKPGASMVLILGDSAPYGVHIPTEQYLGEIGLGIGFKEYRILELRQRGGKWKGNPQRHHVALRESILTLRK
jgi:DNA modification methylase